MAKTRIKKFCRGCRREIYKGSNWYVYKTVSYGYTSVCSGCKDKNTYLSALQIYGPFTQL